MKLSTKIKKLLKESLQFTDNKDAIKDAIDSVEASKHTISELIDAYIDDLHKEK